ncbi:MAG TPA: metallophosphoesterase [Jatrophihabitans sp.]|jgi:predicted MPP superfamily phosphohydrolase|nr:metallophosphoesterase [Jatrophihabitans sp.]
MRRGVIALGTAGTGALLYGTLIERNAFTVRRFDVPVLAPGAQPLRVLHLADLHITAGQRRKLAWIRRLLDLAPDLVINTGDTLSARDAIPAVMSALEPFAAVPAVFVPGNNDYYVPTFRNPTEYFRPNRPVRHGPSMPWPQLASALTHAGWLDLTHARMSLKVNGATVALAGTDDPHLRRARYELIAGAAPVSADVRIGVTHSPEPFLLRRFANDGYDLVLAGHTHGGQVRLPFGPAIVTNCGIDRSRARWLHAWDDRMYIHVCAGLGTNPFAPVRFCCRPEATLLTLVPKN